MAADASKICKRLGELKAARSPHEQVWRDCYDFTHPLRADGFGGNIVDAQQGLNRKARLLDGTATDSARMLASAIMSGLTPSNALWFQLDADNQTQEEAQFFDAAARTLWLNIHQANFDAEAYECCLDIVDAGWFVLFIDEDRRRGGLTFEQWPISGCYVTSTRADGVVDTIYREYQLTAAAAVAEFGEDALSKEVVELAQKRPDEKVQFAYVIEPRTPHVVGARMAKNLPFAATVVEVKTKKVVRESGFHEFPCAVPRWMKIPNTSYGVGPVYDALPDIRMLNELKGFELANADLAISGMYVAEDDGVLNPHTIKLGPRKIIVAHSVDSIKPLQSGSNFQLSEMLVDKLTASIRKVLMSDQLQPQDGPAMTATEVHVRVQLIRQLLGPIYGRLQAEYLRQVVERCFGLALRAGALPPLPQSLAGRDYAVKYVSPMARAQKLEEVTAVERLFVNLGQLAAAKQDLTVFDQVDTGKAIEVTAEGLGVPAGIMRTPQQAQAIAAQRQQQQKQAQAEAMAAQTTQVGAEAMAKKQATA